MGTATPKHAMIEAPTTIDRRRTWTDTREVLAWGGMLVAAYRSMRALTRAMLLTSVSAASGCSFTMLTPTPCESDEQCRKEFGWGSVCGEEAGLCEAPVTHSRCSQTYPEDLFENPEPYASRVLIGGLFSYTDHFDTLQAAELPIRQVGRLGADTELEFAYVACDYTANAGDDLGDEAATRAVTDYLVNVLHVPAIVGPRGSGRTLFAFDASEGSETVIISPSATSPELTDAEPFTPTDANPGRLWRTAPPDTLQSVAIAGDLVDRGVTSIAILAKEGAYGDGLAALLQTRFEASGGTVHRESFADETTIFGAISRVGDRSEQEVVLISPDISDYLTFLQVVPDSGTLLSQYDAKGLFLTDAARNQRLIDESPDAVPLFDNIRGSRPAPAEGANFNVYASAFNKEFPETGADTSAFMPHSYDASWLVIYGAAWSMAQEGEVTPLGIRRGLRKIVGGTHIVIEPGSWSTALEHFAEGDAIDVDGASGALDYDLMTEETTAPIELWSIGAVGMNFEFQREAIIDPGEP
jgi:ABC-type branched-subunit amino acid transport system substrate-binding protein